MHAAIIAAGHGERLRPAGRRVPKPLVEVNGIPLIEHVLQVITAAGLRKAVCIINEESRAVEDHCRQRIVDLELTFVHRTTPNSMESLFTLAPYLGRDPFLLLTVDVIMAPDTLRGFLAAASRRDADGVLAVHTFIDDEKPLRVACDREGRIVAIGTSAAGSPLITAGFYLLRPAMLAERDAARGAGCAALRDFLAHVVAHGYRLDAEQVPKCVDVDRPEDIAAAEQFIRSGYRA